MEILWFCLVALMLAIYTILDGFDIGAGILHLLVAKTDEERRSVLAAIGPFWDGNEVWLLASGGTLYFAFPLLYASSFSGFYLPLMIVLWLLIMRGLGIELRHQVDHPLWRAFWDGVFALGSTLLAVFLGAALGNVVRGVPIGDHGYFFEPLWTSFTVQPDAGIIDWFTLLMGVLGLATLASHGANYLAMKTEGEVQKRARGISQVSSSLVALACVITIVSAGAIRPGLFGNFAAYPWGWIFPLIGVCGLAGMLFYGRKGADRRAFLASSAFIASMLAATAFALFPDVLPASNGAQNDLTIYNTSAPSYGLSVGVIWWVIGMVLALTYFTYLFMRFKGKVTLHSDGY